MRRFQIMLIVGLCFVLVGCSELTNFLESITDGNENEVETNNLEEANDVESVDATETVEVENQANEAGAEEADENNQVSSHENTNEDHTLSADEILTRSYDAMEDLSTIFMESFWEIQDLTPDGNNLEERQINSIWDLTEPYAQRQRLTLTPVEPAGETQVTETYKIDGKHYVHYPHDIWRYEDNPEGSASPTTFITNDSLESSLAYANQFEVVEEADVYYLTFSGNLDDFMEVMWGGATEFVAELLRRYQMPLTDIMNSYHITIEKDTFFVRNYDLHYEAQMADAGDYNVVIDANIRFANYNSYGKMELPQEVLDEAEPF